MFKAASGAVYRRVKVAPQFTPVSFGNSLQSSLVPENANGSGTPAFVRATAATQTDFEGKLNQVLSGEVRFQGARRVANLCARSDTLTAAAGWTLTNTTSVVGATDPLGGSTAYTVTATAINGLIYRSATVTAASTKILNSIWLRRITGTGAVSIIRPINSAYVDISAQLTTSWKRFALAGADITAANAGVNAFIGLQLATSGDVVAAYAPLQEDVTGQTNQNPSEYVPSLATANADSNAIGVRYFTTLNGNTVASNVVTEATGAAINSSQGACAGGVTAGVVDASGPLGYLAEGVRTNLCLQSENFTTTWAVSAAADMNTPTADQYVALDGATTMDKLSTKATNSTHYMKQVFTFSATTYTFSCYLRYIAATPIRWAALALNDGTTTWAASFDLLNGVVGALAANTTSKIEATALANVYRCSMTTTTNAAAAAGTINISLNGSDSASLQSWNAAGTELLGAWGAQLE